MEKRISTINEGWEIKHPPEISYLNYKGEHY